MTTVITGPLMRAIIFIEGEDEDVTVDVIEFEQRLWAVPEWLELPGRGGSNPRRIVLLDLMTDQRSAPDEEIVLIDPMPRSVLYGPTPSQPDERYTVRDLPDVLLTAPKYPPGKH